MFVRERECVCVYAIIFFVSYKRLCTLVCVSYVLEYKCVCKSVSICIWTFSSLSLSLSVYVCVVLTIVIFPYNFHFSFNHTLFHRICLAPSKRNREIRALFSSFLLFTLQLLNYFLLPLLPPLSSSLMSLFRRREKRNCLACFCLQLSLLPCTLQIFCTVSLSLSAFILFSLYLSCNTTDL